MTTREWWIDNMLVIQPWFPTIENGNLTNIVTDCSWLIHISLLPEGKCRGIFHFSRRTTKVTPLLIFETSGVMKQGKVNKCCWDIWWSIEEGMRAAGVILIRILTTCKSFRLIVSYKRFNSSITLKDNPFSNAYRES
jgi:hypothetical protein